MTRQIRPYADGAPVPIQLSRAWCQKSPLPVKGLNLDGILSYGSSFVQFYNRFFSEPFYNWFFSEPPQSESQASTRPSRKRGIRALLADVSN